VRAVPEGAGGAKWRPLQYKRSFGEIEVEFVPYLKLPRLLDKLRGGIRRGVFPLNLSEPWG
jgi:hypothetical protein